MMCFALDVSSKPSLSSISSPTVSVTGEVPKEPARILGSGNVDHDRAVGHERAQPAQPRDPRGDVAVGEGEAKDVDARDRQGLQYLVALRGRTDGGYDSRASHVVPFVTFDKSK